MKTRMLQLIQELNNSKNGKGETEKADNDIFQYVLELYERIALGKDSTKLAGMTDMDAINECILYLLSKHVKSAV